MKEFVDGFKVDLEELWNDMYQKLDELVADALFNMSFFEGDVDEHYAMLQDVMVKMVQEKMACVFNEDGDLN